MDTLSVVLEGGDDFGILWNLFCSAGAFKHLCPVPGWLNDGSLLASVLQ